jgi:TPR repeat protein
MMKLLFIFATLFLLVSCESNEATKKKGIEAFDSEAYAEAHSLLLPLAESGDPAAAFYIAKIYQSGLGVAVDLQKAFKFYTQSANDGFPKSQNNLGMMFLNGQSVPRDPFKAYAWIQKAADQGLSLSQHLMGIALTSEGSPIPLDAKRGRDYLERAAKQDDAPALLTLAEYTGRAGELEKAAKYVQRSVDLGHHPALLKLSQIYYSGAGLAQDHTKGFELLKSAAEQNVTDSFFPLGLNYLWGNGTDQDFERGIYWLEQSVEVTQNADAMEALANIQIEQREGYLTKVETIGSIEDGVNLRVRAANQENAVAQHNLFIQLYNGNNIDQNKTEAIKWLMRSAENGYPPAQYDLGRNYLNGWDLQKDQKRAFELYRAAAEEGFEDAIVAVGSAYYVGLGVDKNYLNAIQWFERVPEDTSLFIGAIYAEGGFGVTKNRDKAEHWLKTSEEPISKAHLVNLYLSEDFGERDLARADELAKTYFIDSKKNSVIADIPSLSIQAMTALGVFFWQEGNIEKGEFWLNHAAKLGESKAQMYLGFVYSEGDGVPKNLKRGLLLLEKAAEQGEVGAATIIASHYFTRGRYSQARYWAEKFATRDQPELALIAGITYMGRLADEELAHLDVDLVKARYWMEFARDSGNQEANEALEIITTEEIKEANRLAANERREARRQIENQRKMLARDQENKQLEAKRARLRKQAEAEESTNWLGALLGAALVNYAVNRYEKKQKKKKKNRSQQSYDFSNTGGMSSAQLGAELLRQKQEKGISGRGYVASYETPSIGYNPRSSSTTSVQPSQSGSNLCKYTVGAKTISVSKRNSWSSCPTSLEIPNDMNTHFDLSQMGSSTGTLRYLENKTSRDYCYYEGSIQIPKAAYGSCRASIVY